MRAPRRLSAAILTLGLCAATVIPSRLTSPDTIPADRGRLRVEGRAFVAANGRRFPWRGLTAFQLVERVAHGRAKQAGHLLDWASAHGVTVVRVLAMADVLFRLTPEEGRRALPPLLSLAAARGLHVEVVALADTGRYAVDLDEQVRAVGAICRRHANCVLEIANEPWTRQTQRPDLGTPGRLLALRRLVAPVIPVSIGSGPDDESEIWAAGDYVTVHVSRAPGDRGWDPVLGMVRAEALSRRTGKPVIDDEPIGAGPRYEPGRRDDDRSRWLGRGVLARLAGLGTTFHYEAGLHALVPEGREAECFEAWRAGLDSVPVDLEGRTVFREAGPGAAVSSFDRARALAVFVAEGESEAWAVAFGVSGEPRLQWRNGWRVAATKDLGGVSVVRARAVSAPTPTAVPAPWAGLPR